MQVLKVTAGAKGDSRGKIRIHVFLHRHAAPAAALRLAAVLSTLWLAVAAAVVITPSHERVQHNWDAV